MSAMTVGDVDGVRLRLGGAGPEAPEHALLLSQSTWPTCYCDAVHERLYWPGRPPDPGGPQILTRTAGIQVLIVVEHLGLIKDTPADRLDLAQCMSALGQNPIIGVRLLADRLGWEVGSLTSAPGFYESGRL